MDRDDDNVSYNDRYIKIMKLLFIVLGVIFVALIILTYQIVNRPLPIFYAKSQAGNVIQLTPSLEPNLQPQTIINWASKAAVLAYTFDFVHYPEQFATAKPYFTDAGWIDYQQSVSKVISSIREKQLFVNSVISGQPVISHQGEIPGRGFVWRIQLPFLVTYQSSEETQQFSYTVTVTIVRVGTNINPAGIGIDQFVMG